jgi:hypothetical protein
VLIFHELIPPPFRDSSELGEREGFLRSYLLFSPNWLPYRPNIKTGHQAGFAIGSSMTFPADQASDQSWSSTQRFLRCCDAGNDENPSLDMKRIFSG